MQMPAEGSDAAGKLKGLRHVPMAAVLLIYTDCQCELYRLRKILAECRNQEISSTNATRPIYFGSSHLRCELGASGAVGEAREASTRLKEVFPETTIAWIKDYVPYTAGPMEKFIEGMRKAGLEKPNS
jgi:hypothetical protein